MKQDAPVPGKTQLATHELIKQQPALAVDLDTLMLFDLNVALQMHILQGVDLLPKTNHVHQKSPARTGLSLI